MENTLAVCAEGFPTILGVFKKYQQTRSVNILSSSWIWSKQSKKCVLQAKGPPSRTLLQQGSRYDDV